MTQPNEHYSDRPDFVGIHKKLYEELKSHFRQYLYANDEEIAILSIYAVATHIYDVFHAFPYLHITGDFETGKNRRLELLAPLCYNSTTLISPSVSSLFRTIDETRGTMLIDDADSILINEEILKILLNGYKKGGCVTRSMQDIKHEKGFRTAKFNVYSPKVIATRNGINDDALLSRCITLVTSPKPKGSTIPNIIPDKAVRQGEELREKISKAVKELNLEVNNEN